MFNKLKNLVFILPLLMACGNDDDKNSAVSPFIQRPQLTANFKDIEVSQVEDLLEEYQYSSAHYLYTGDRFEIRKSPGLLYYLDYPNPVTCEAQIQTQYTVAKSNGFSNYIFIEETNAQVRTPGEKCQFVQQEMNKNPKTIYQETLSNHSEILKLLSLLKSEYLWSLKYNGSHLIFVQYKLWDNDDDQEFFIEFFIDLNRSYFANPSYLKITDEKTNKSYVLSVRKINDATQSQTDYDENDVHDTSNSGQFDINVLPFFHSL